MEGGKLVPQTPGIVPQGRHIVAQGDAQQALGLGRPTPRAPAGRHRRIAIHAFASAMSPRWGSGFFFEWIPGFASLTPGLRCVARSGLRRNKGSRTKGSRTILSAATIARIMSEAPHLGGGTDHRRSRLGWCRASVPGLSCLLASGPVSPRTRMSAILAASFGLDAPHLSRVPDRRGSRFGWCRASVPDLSCRLASGPALPRTGMSAILAARSGLDAESNAVLDPPPTPKAATEPSSGGAAVSSLGWSAAEPQEHRTITRLNLRSGWQNGAHRLCHPLRGFNALNHIDLGLTPQANDWHPLRGLRLGATLHDR